MKSDPELVEILVRKVFDGSNVYLKRNEVYHFFNTKMFTKPLVNEKIIIKHAIVILKFEE